MSMMNGKFSLFAKNGENAIKGGIAGDTVTDDEKASSGMIEREQMDSIVAAAGVDAAGDIMNAFWRSTDTLVDAIETSLANGAMKDAANNAHALKGSAANVGATGISSHMSEFEKHCLEGNEAGASAAFSDIQTCIEKSRAAFSQYFESVNA